jgi:hypothetical protein
VKVILLLFATAILLVACHQSSRKASNALELAWQKAGWINFKEYYGPSLDCIPNGSHPTEDLRRLERAYATFEKLDKEATERFPDSAPAYESVTADACDPNGPMPNVKAVQQRSEALEAANQKFEQQLHRSILF